MEPKKQRTNKQTRNRNRPIKTENKLTDAREENGEGMSNIGEGEWEVQTLSYGMNKSQI